LDDGPKEQHQTNEILDAYSLLGYSTVAATPHFNHGMFPLSSVESIEETLATAAADREEHSPSIVAGAEIMFSDGFADQLDAGTLPRLGPSDTYLLEFGSQPGSVPLGFEENVFRLQTKEIALVIAHCERYADLQNNMRKLEQLRQGGAIIQINLMSLIGRYGRGPMKAAWKILENGLADIAASDLHSIEDIPRISQALSELYEWDPDDFIRLTATNPRRILEGNPWEIDKDE